MPRRETRRKAGSVASSTMLIAGTVVLVLALAIGGFVVWRQSQTIPPPPPGVADVTPEGFPVKGAPTAPITVVEYADFQCPNCRRFVDESLPAFGPYVQAGMVRLVFHDFPIRGEESILAAEAARCALEQNAFWPYHDLLFDKQAGVNDGTFLPVNLRAYAADLGLDRQAFGRCLDARKYRRAVEQALADAQAMGLEGTPSFMLQDPVAVRDPFAGDPGPARWEDLFQRYINDFGWPSP